MVGVGLDGCGVGVREGVEVGTVLFLTIIVYIDAVLATPFVPRDTAEPAE